MTTILSDAGVQFADGSSLSSGSQLGIRNFLINGNYNINQRAYVSGTATVAANQYTLDRWRVITLGQSHVFATSGNGNSVTAPAGGIEQIIEGANIGVTAGVINWVGTATCTVDGIAKTKGQAITLVPGTNCSVKLFGGTASQVQLEAGTVPTPFEYRFVGFERQLCQRYYCEVLGVAATAINTGGIFPFGFWPVNMRVTPTLTTSNTAATFGILLASGWYQNANDSASNIFTIRATAEL